MAEHGAVVFNGDGYADSWQIEAAQRGLPNLKTTLDALPELISDASLELFDSYGVFSHREMHSRYEIALEQYVMSIDVEAALTLEIATTQVLPSALRYQTELAVNVSSLLAAGVGADTSTLDETTSLVDALRSSLATLREALSTADHATEEDRARHCQDAVMPAMVAVRSAADALESTVADDLWPLPTYQEMLFIL